jgi:hypothetical protein
MNRKDGICIWAAYIFSSSNAFGVGNERQSQRYHSDPAVIAVCAHLQNLPIKTLIRILDLTSSSFSGPPAPPQTAPYASHPNTPKAPPHTVSFPLYRLTSPPQLLTALAKPARDIRLFADLRNGMEVRADREHHATRARQAA